MTEVNSSDFNKICRGCLCKNGEMRPLYGSCLDNMLGAVAEIDVNCCDGLPESLCVPCVLQCSRAFTFKQQCRRSDQLLRQVLKEQKSKANETIESNLTQINQQIEQIDDATNIITFQSENFSETLILDDSACVLRESETEHSNEEFLTEVLIDDSTVGDDVIDDTDANDIALQLYVANNISLDDNTEQSFEDHSIIGNNSSTDDIITEVLGAVESVDETFLEENTIVLASSQPNHSLSPPQNIETENFECLTCHKVFGQKKILKRHLKIHNPNKPHVCKTCNMSFVESSNLRKHEKKHTGELRNVQGKPNLCSICGKAFKWASSLSKHMKHHTRHKILNCPYCPKYYVERRSLNIHLRSHTGDRPYKCSHCNKGFTQQGNLDKHIRVHTGERPFSCPVIDCNKSFSQIGYIAIHLRSHTGDRPYSCGFQGCGKSFAGSNTLAIHKRTHTGERPYSCTVDGCGKVFARKETAVIHQRTHTGERPHVCLICDRKFTSSSHLTGHMKSHSNDPKIYECNVCQKNFSTASSLKVHMKTHIEKTMPAQQQQQQQTIVFECTNHSSSAVLPSSDTIGAYNHELINDVLICTNSI